MYIISADQLWSTACDNEFSSMELNGCCAPGGTATVWKQTNKENVKPQISIDLTYHRFTELPTGFMPDFI